jgi:SAM-dependent methyltransferase
MKLKMTKANLIDPGHSTEANYRMWQYHNWQEHEWSPSIQWEQDTFSYFVGKYVKKFDTVLEIAPGNGRWTHYLLQIANELIAVDLIDKAIEMCKERFAGADNLFLYKNDGRTLPMVRSNCIDFVWSHDSFVHMSPDIVRDYIKEFSRVMKKGAIAIIHHGVSNDKTGWRSTLTQEMFDSFLTEFGLTKIETVYTWGDNQQYHFTHDDSFDVFTK